MDPLYISPEERIRYKSIETTNIKTELDIESNAINLDDFEQKPLIKTEELDLGGDVIVLSDDDGTERFLCDHCGFSSFSASLFTQHKVHHAEPTEKEFKCEDCPFKASYKADLNKHISEKHLVDLEFLRKSTPLLESILKDKEAMITYKKSLLEADSMTRSSRNEQNQKLVYCGGKCPFKTYSIDTLKKHIKQHRDWKISSKKMVEKPAYFKCGKCGYINFSRMKVIAHMKCVHMQQRQQELKFSKNINAKIKQEQTQKSQVVKETDNLNVKATAYKCSQCDYKNFNPMKVIGHMKRYHRQQRQQVKSKVKKKPVNLNTIPMDYRCSKCDYRNFSRREMIAHMKSFHPIQQNTIKTVTWYKCGKCSFKDLTEELVKSHLMIFHV